MNDQESLQLGRREISKKKSQLLDVNVGFSLSTKDYSFVRFVIFFFLSFHDVSLSIDFLVLDGTRFKTRFRFTSNLSPIFRVVLHFVFESSF